MDTLLEGDGDGMGDVAVGLPRGGEVAIAETRDSVALLGGADAPDAEVAWEGGDTRWGNVFPYLHTNSLRS